MVLAHVTIAELGAAATLFAAGLCAGAALALALARRASRR